MKLTSSSTAHRKTFFAFSRSGGQPQIPSPVNRIAPNPSRSTVISPPNRNVDLVAAAAVTSFGNPPAKIVTPPASVTPRNFLRVTSWSMAKPNIRRHRPQMLLSVLVFLRDQAYDPELNSPGPRVQSRPTAFCPS